MILDYRKFCLLLKANRMHFSYDAFLICTYPQVEGRDILPVAELAHM